MAKYPGLMRRGATYYYRVRVPLDVVKIIGKPEIKESLKTTDYAEAKRRRNERALYWQAHFDRARSEATQPSTAQPKPLTEQAAVTLVQQYVEHRSREWHQRYTQDGPENLEQKKDLLMDAELPIQFLDDPQDPRGDELISLAITKILQDANVSLENSNLSYGEFANLVERAIRELQNRQIDVLRGKYKKNHFDFLFDPASINPTKSISLKAMSDEFFDHYAKQAKVKKIDRKRIDKVRTSLDLVNEIIGADTPISEIDYDRCNAFVDTLSKAPKNRRKFYPSHTLEQAIAAAEEDGRPPASYSTQQVHLQSLNSVLKLAVKKGLIATVPSADMTPYAEKVPNEDKRKSFTTDQLKLIFNAPIYTGCKNDHIGFSRPGPHVIRRARFWVPLICLFMGMRPNEVCQLYVKDLKVSDAGTHYLDVVKDQDDKKLKNETSRRVFPVHPELKKIGFLEYVSDIEAKGNERIFPELKADNYGYYSTKLADWFSDSFLNSIKVKEKGRSLYSLRHNFRDALRFANAPDWVLQALGGWDQGTKVSDNYGSTDWPDQINVWVKKIQYDGLDLSHLYVKK